MVIRVALYSHDSVGLGHVRRNLAIAHALTRSLPDLLGEPVTGMLITGQPGATGFAVPAGWDWMSLPGVTVGETGYASRHLAAGIDRLTAIRGGAVAAALRAFAADLVIVDRHPFGVHRELADALRQVRTHRPTCGVVLGLRDVLDRRSAAEAEWHTIGGPVAVREHYDALWVYGDPAVHDLTASGEVPRGLHDLVSFTGYLSHGRPATGQAGIDEPFVLTTVGGGSDGGLLAESAARSTAPPGHRHVVVTGPQMPDARRAAIRAAAAPGTIVLDAAPDVPSLLHRASAAVCMGGYNTVTEVMSTATPALVVPRTNRRAEQRIRARALARAGAIDTITAPEATPAAITDFFARACGTHVPRTTVDLDGLAAIGPLAAGLITRLRRCEGVSRAI